MPAIFTVRGRDTSLLTSNSNLKGNFSFRSKEKSTIWLVIANVSPSLSNNFVCQGAIESRLSYLGLITVREHQKTFEPTLHLFTSKSRVDPFCPTNLYQHRNRRRCLW